MTVAEVKHDNLPKPTSEQGTRARRAGRGGAESAVRTQLRGLRCGFTQNIQTPPEVSALLIYNDTTAANESKDGKIQAGKYQNNLCLRPLPLLLSARGTRELPSQNAAADVSHRSFS